MNKPLLKQTLDHIKANPESWDQSRWFCGTAACFAGHACLLSGDRRGPALPFAFKNAINDVITAEGVQKFTQDRAEELLGVSQSQADALFYQDNRMEDLERMVDNLLNDRRIDYGFSADDLERLCFDWPEDEYEEDDDETSWGEFSLDDEGEE